MATVSSLSAPGVEVREYDNSLRITSNTGTTVFVPGYAAQGPVEEVLPISSIQEFETVYGIPTNAAERYFYYTCLAILNNSGLGTTLLTSRLPYGDGLGDSVADAYSMLVYPAIPVIKAENNNYKFYKRYVLTDSNNIEKALNAEIIFVSTKEINNEIITLQVSGQSVTIDGIVSNSPIDTYTETVGDNTYTYHAGELKDSSNNVIGYLNITLINEAFANYSLNDFNNAEFKIANPYEISNDLDKENLTYLIGAPAVFNVSLSEYYQIISGEYFTWNNTVSNLSNFGNNLKDSISSAALIAINTSRSIINSSHEGCYFGITDNLFNNISDDYQLDAIRNVKFAPWNRNPNNSAGIIDNKANSKFITINESLLDFKTKFNKGSLSDIIQSTTSNFDTSSSDYDDTVNFAVFKLKKSVTGSETMKLTYNTLEKYNASLGKNRQYSTSTNVTPQNYFVESIIESSKNVTILVNPYIANKIKVNSEGNLEGKVRFFSSKLIDTFEKYEKKYLGTKLSQRLSSEQRVKAIKNNIENWNTLSKQVGISPELIKNIESDENYINFNRNDSLYQFGVYTIIEKNNNLIGLTPGKIKRALELVSNDEEYPDIDIIVDGGLSTIYAYSNNALSDYVISNKIEDNNIVKGIFKEDILLQGVEDLRTSRSSITNLAELIRSDYLEVQNAFQSLANSFQNGGRGDTFYIADILRGAVIYGLNTKVEKMYGTDMTNNTYGEGSIKHSWPSSILSPIKHITDGFTSSYASIYAQWFKVHDNYTNEKYWIPSSGYMAALMCATDQLHGPWYAGAGLNRGIVSGVVDVAINPTQKQRGDLYKICVNSVPKIAKIGITNWGIRTLSKKASAFDQNTCRRTFLFIEKAIKKLLRYYLFEPNNSYTQLSIYNEIEPYMESIRNQGGIYSYSVVVDSTNNTPEIINAGNLAVDVSAAPTRTAEFIVLNMTANKNTQEVITSEFVV